MPERSPYTYDTMMGHYTGHGAEKTDQVSSEGEQLEQEEQEQNIEEEEVLAELVLEDAEEGEPMQGSGADGFSTKKLSVTVLLGAITFMWYQFNMVMWW